MPEVVSCPACGAPLEINDPTQSVVCGSCGREIQPELFRNQLGSSEPEIVDVTAQPVPPGDEVDLGEPSANYETSDTPSGAQVYSIPEAGQPAGRLPGGPAAPEKKKMNPWLLGAIIAVLVICLACVCVAVALALFVVPTWNTTSMILLPPLLM